LFNDLPADALEALAATVQDARFGEGAWILDEGVENAGLFVILDGEAGVVLDGMEVTILHAGMFFGEISALLDEPVTAGIVARSRVRCAVIDRAELKPFLLAQPSVTLRLLQAEARRLADMNRWRA
jgi:CRP/FNR family cyclic AMP-dependent transcriptional regulator